MERDAVAGRQLAAIGRFELLLSRRERGTQRVVDQVQGQRAVWTAITKCVESPQCVDRSLENALPALGVYVLFEIAGKRGDDFDLMPREELSQVFKTGHREDRQ